MAVEGEEEEEEDGNMQRHRKSLGTDISFGWKLSGLENILKGSRRKFVRINNTSLISFYKWWRASNFVFFFFRKV